jgi:hypothetical protein
MSWTARHPILLAFRNPKIAARAPFADSIQNFSRIGKAFGNKAISVSRFATFARHASAESGHSSQGGQRAIGTFRSWNHLGSIFARAAGDAGRGNAKARHFVVQGIRQILRVTLGS